MIIEDSYELCILLGSYKQVVLDEIVFMSKGIKCPPQTLHSALLEHTYNKTLFVCTIIAESFFKFILKSRQFAIPNNV